MIAALVTSGLLIAAGYFLFPRNSPNPRVETASESGNTVSEESAEHFANEESIVEPDLDLQIGELLDGFILRSFVDREFAAKISNKQLKQIFANSLERAPEYVSKSLQDDLVQAMYDELDWLINDNHESFEPLIERFKDGRRAYRRATEGESGAEDYDEVDGSMRDKLGKTGYIELMERYYREEGRYSDPQRVAIGSTINFSKGKPGPMLDDQEFSPKAVAYLRERFPDDADTILEKGKATFKREVWEETYGPEAIYAHAYMVLERKDGGFSAKEFTYVLHPPHKSFYRLHVNSQRLDGESPFLVIPQFLNHQPQVANQ